MLVCVFYVHLAHETAGAARTRLSLRPLLFGEGESDARLGHLMPRECGPASSRCLTIESEIVAIASLDRQSTNVSSGLPFSTIYVASSLAVVLPTFFAA